MTLAELAHLRSPATVRERAGQVLTLAQEDRLQHFCLRPQRMDAVADLVADTVRSAYPDMRIPIHGRFRHFAVGGVDRLGAYRRRLAGEGAVERGRALTELVIVSVLLDAGAGTQWRYAEATTGMSWRRSEGLAVASFDFVAGGALSVDPLRPWRVDADRLVSLRPTELAKAFQDESGNALVGVEGRTLLLQRLGAVVARRPDVFGREARLGVLFDSLARAASRGRMPAAEMLRHLLETFSEIWPGGLVVDGVNLGDVGRHPAVVATDATGGLVPFHKLSQWLAYSLVEPMAEGGVEVTGLDALTGLPEYRNGGLFVDGGVLELREPRLAEAGLKPDDEPVVEWRALTVALLDRVLPMVRRRLDLDASRFSMAQLLEGGTWSAGRRLAAERRAEGAPPIRVVSDGTVF
jgi:hypothetical protein